MTLTLWSVPEPQVINENIEKVFLENDFSTLTEMELLKVLASSGSIFESSIILYSSIIFTLVIITISMVVISFGSLIVQHTSAAAIRRAEKQRAAGHWDRAKPCRKVVKNKWRLAALNQRQHGNVEHTFRSDIRR